EHAPRLPARQLRHPREVLRERHPRGLPAGLRHGGAVAGGAGPSRRGPPRPDPGLAPLPEEPGLVRAQVRREAQRSEAPAGAWTVLLPGLAGAAGATGGATALTCATSAGRASARTSSWMLARVEPISPSSAWRNCRSTSARAMMRAIIDSSAQGLSAAATAATPAAARTTKLSTATGARTVHPPSPRGLSSPTYRLRRPAPGKGSQRMDARTCVQTFDGSFTAR